MSSEHTEDLNSLSPPRALHAESETEAFTTEMPQSDSRRELPHVPAGTEVQGRFRFRVDRQLSKGGFGYIYTGNCLDSLCDSLDGPSPYVVLKFFDPPMGLDPITMLKRELSAMLAMKHDRIIRVFDWSLEQPYAFVALEYFPNGSLHDAAFPDGLDDEETAWRLLEHLLSALNAAHRASILHLDIKPGNVLLDNHGGFVLTDFGISQGSLVSRSIIDFGVGSLGYQAPEQQFRRDDQIGVLTDLWGVGATVWSAFTAMRLDLNPELFETDENAAPFALPPVSRFRSCSAAFEGVLMSLLAINPARRPGGAAEALKMVQAARSPVVSARPPISGIAAGSAMTETEMRTLFASLVDPLWASICSGHSFVGRFVKFSSGEALCREGDNSFYTFVLLKGKVVIEQGGREINTETREGTFLGEVATLTGERRLATVRAEGDVYTCVFNAAELEKFVTENPAVGIRLIRTLADRVSTANRTTPA